MMIELFVQGFMFGAGVFGFITAVAVSTVVLLLVWIAFLNILCGVMGWPK